ncbi:hypothetical protein [Stygiolobus caldivivus]|uniref:Uncharacterized protein n=1 Tax=Stygiolobus caldivivus TaxID=2824673 RepID=A0A8D5U400_9CREN|nr:hypothetical protein [Stygiolobus caldivivus]BCU68854.1 hypothetical protein KN1_01510 [Stygiolobus caldivivus]
MSYGNDIWYNIEDVGMFKKVRISFYKINDTDSSRRYMMRYCHEGYHHLIIFTY